MKTNFHLLLRGNAVEAATTGVTLDVDDAETVAGVFADALEGGEGALVDLGFEGLGFLAEVLFFLTGLADDFVELVALFVENVGEVGEFLACCLDFGLLVLDGAVIFVDMLFGKLDLERLELDFFCEKVELAVVANVVELLLILVD